MMINRGDRPQTITRTATRSPLKPDRNPAKFRFHRASSRKTP
ncbi:hypothetical protein [Laspinema olomoucense]|nr:hypothetical protein [Laspinema sp. D3b]